MYLSMFGHSLRASDADEVDPAVLGNVKKIVTNICNTADEADELHQQQLRDPELANHMLESVKQVTFMAMQEGRVRCRVRVCNYICGSGVVPWTAILNHTSLGSWLCMLLGMHVGC